jgi:hypothetical protein
MYVETLRGIVGAQAYGDMRERAQYQFTYYGVEDEGRLLALLQVVVSGEGRLKTVKLLDILPAPGTTKLGKATRVALLMSIIAGILGAADSLIEDGNRIRVVKIYGRTTDILGALKLLAEELSEASENMGYGVMMEGGWLSFYPINGGD